MKKTSKKKPMNQPPVERPEVTALDAAKETMLAATIEYLNREWKDAGLGQNGAVVVPKGWSEGPERNRHYGLLRFLTHNVSWDIGVQVSETKSELALLDSKDQSKKFAQFLMDNDADLVRLATL